MKKTLLICLMLIPFFSVGQKTVKIKVNEGRSFCGFSLKKGFYSQGQVLEYITREAQVGDKSGIPDVIQEIKATLGFEVPIRIFIASEEDNCFASIGADGIRMIVADQLFLNRVNKTSGTQWAAISIIAHEIGHHIAGFTMHSSQLRGELDADYWSGYVLQKLGASKGASVKCIMHFGTEQDTNSHPNKYSRAATIRQGWEDAVRGSYDPDRCADCKK